MNLYTQQARDVMVLVAATLRNPATLHLFVEALSDEPELVVEEVRLCVCFGIALMVLVPVPVTHNNRFHLW